MTINKSQGQSLKVTGIDLTKECFSHGQLYVAMSRTQDSNQLYILTIYTDKPGQSRAQQLVFYKSYYPSLIHYYFWVSLLLNNCFVCFFFV